jgi:1,4-dihydroxy-2-naphthoate octaprenyltransferase
MGSLRARRYSPGLITGLLLYIPLGIMAYIVFWRSDELSIMQGILSILVGLAYQAVPVGYLGLASLLRRA